VSARLLHAAALVMSPHQGLWEELVRRAQRARNML
jgi:hypothetical protein